MLDDDERPAAVTESARFADLRIPQFWDGKQALGREVARSLGAPDWTAWDIYLFYPPDADWLGPSFPIPDTALVQTHGAILANKGKLPPLADQARLPPQFKDRAEVVGEISALPSLLSQVGARFVRP